MDARSSFIEQIQQHQGVVNKIVFLYADTPEDQQDLRQEILTQAWKSYANFRQESAFSTWLYRVGLNVALTTLRKSKQSPLQRWENETSEAKVHPQDSHELLQVILRVLNPIEKSIVLLMIEGYKQPEIAKILGISEGNTRTKIHRLRQKLKSYGIERFAE